MHLDWLTLKPFSCDPQSGHPCSILILPLLAKSYDLFLGIVLVIHGLPTLIVFLYHHTLGLLAKTYGLYRVLGISYFLSGSHVIYSLDRHSCSILIIQYTWIGLFLSTCFVIYSLDTLGLLAKTYGLYRVLWIG